MPAVMRILGWSAEGLRCPDHDINLCDQSGSPVGVALIQMPNGTGKTTTLNLLRAAMSGPGYGTGWPADAVYEFRRREPQSDSGRFELRLLLNGKRVTIILNFDFDSARVSYKTTRGKGQFDGFDPPTEFCRFMNDNFVNFFIFDGELAANLLKKTHTDAEAVVENLFQISTLRIVSQKVADHWDEYAQSVSATEEKGLARRKNRLTSLRNRLKKLESERGALIDRKRKANEQLEKWRGSFDQQIKKEKERAERIATAQGVVAKLEATIHDRAALVLDRAREPNALSSVFARQVHELKTGLDRVKLPESAAREFFEELAGEPECVCGRPIDESIREVIRTRAKRYLGSDDVSLLNAMKTAIEEAVGRSQEEPEKALLVLLNELERNDQLLREAKNALDALTIEAEQTDPEIKHASEEIRRLEADVADLGEQLERYDNKDDSLGDEHTYGTDVVKRRISDAEKKWAEATHTLALREKRDVLMAILQKAQERASKQIGEEICREANAHIGRLLPHNNISIDRIDRCLVLKKQGGGSVGETLSISYAFLSTLFDRAEHELPFVVDSPAGPIDLAVRPKIGDLVPKLSKQFVAFTISSERDQFLPALQKTGKEILYLTLFRKGPKELERQARAVKGVLETENGMLVQGATFFESFQVEEEES